MVKRSLKHHTYLLYLLHPFNQWQDAEKCSMIDGEDSLVLLNFVHLYLDLEIDLEMYSNDVT